MRFAVLRPRLASLTLIRLRFPRKPALGTVTRENGQGVY